MRKILFLLLCAPSLLFAQNDSLVLRKIYDYYLVNGKAYDHLRDLTKNIGGRLSGSAQAAKAVAWAQAIMKASLADTVYLQPCLVPHWERGAKEICYLTANGKKTSLKVTALGSSFGTGEKGITASVVEVSSFDELEKLGTAVKGKIVFYNVFFDQRHISTGSAYGETVKYRALGASRAAKFGALAVLVRSMSSVADDEPHTGNMRYDTTISRTKIPAVALSYFAADDLHSALQKQTPVTVYLETHCKQLPPSPSYNVVAQLNGTVDNKILVSGGHLDSWDNGEGAHDDGAGVVQTIEILYMYKALGLKPRHTIRVVAFMNEENGLAGGQAYAMEARLKNEVHLAALETDAGGFTPRGFGVDTLNGLYKTVSGLKKLFDPYLTMHLTSEGGGADISPLEEMKVPCIGFEPDSQRYFDIHHTARDVFETVNKRELHLGGAAIGALIYLLDQHL